MTDEPLDEALSVLRRDEDVAEGDETLARILRSNDEQRLLDEALAALRARPSAVVDDATRAATLSRIQRSLAPRRERRGAVWFWRAAAAAAGLVLVLGAPTAWAWAMRFASELELLESSRAPAPQTEAPSPEAAPAHDIAVPGPAPVGPAETTLAPPRPSESPVTPTVAPGARPRARHSSPSDPPAGPPSVPAPEPAGRPPEVADTPAEVSSDATEQNQFQRAHRIHFGDEGPIAALRAWDEYLSAYPRGRFVQEARYNRAISLVRLGRAAEAQRALRPFASGELGGYRQAEAQDLIEALDPLRGPHLDSAP